VASTPSRRVATVADIDGSVATEAVARKAL
jgi:hypothetical protein